ncbi:MAG: hypothetical protein K6F55_07435 [Eubacterium sp.]|nr:hypothetical protein [Eubacterium sp.]
MNNRISKKLYNEFLTKYLKRIENEKGKIEKHPYEFFLFYSTCFFFVLGLAVYICTIFYPKKSLFILTLVLFGIGILLSHIEIREFVNKRSRRAYRYMYVKRAEIREQVLNEVAQDHGLSNEYQLLYLFGRFQPVHPAVKTFIFLITTAVTASVVLYLPSYDGRYGLPFLYYLILVNLIIGYMLSYITSELKKGFHYIRLMEDYADLKIENMYKSDCNG